MKLRKRRRLLVVREIARRFRWQADGRENFVPYSVISVYNTTEDLAHPQRIFQQGKRMALHQAPKVRRWIRDRLKKPPRSSIPLERVTF